MSGAHSLGPMVGSEALARLAGASDLLILDVRLAADGGRASHEAGHVPGACFTDYARRWLAGEGRRRAGPLPSPEHLAQLLGRLGIEPRHHVVIVPAGTSANDLAASARSTGR